MKRIISISFVFMIVLLSIQTVNAEVISVYAGVNSIDDSVVIPKNLPVNNYSIYVNAEGRIDDYVGGYSIFTIMRYNIVYFTISLDYSQSNFGNISNEVERRFIVSEAGEYNFTFSFYSVYEGDYVNYEILLSEIEIIYNPKTSIISQATYGLEFVFLAIFTLRILKTRREGG